MLNAWQDLRHGFRLLLTNPGFSGISILTLALGIGAATTMFTVVNAVLLRPLPYAEPARLAWVSLQFQERGSEFLPGPDYIEWRDQNKVFESLAAFTSSDRCDLTGIEEPLRITCGRVTANLFPTLGVQPALGRAFLPSEDQPRVLGTAILSHGFWQRRFGGDRAVIGRTVKVDNEQYTIVGVMAADFLPPQNAPVDVLLPLQMDEAEQLQRNRMLLLNSIGRLKPGIRISTASANLAPMFERAQRFWKKMGSASTMRLNVASLEEYSVRNVRLSLLVLLGAVACVLIIACANVANLALGRAVARQREIAVRTALGATPGRLVRQLLTESVLLSSLGAIASLGLVRLTYRWLLRLSPDSVPRVDQAGIDWRVLVFTVILSVTTGILFGVAPAFMASRSEMKQATRGRSYFRSCLVVAELALSLVLLVGAGLLLQSLYRLTNVPTGLRSDNVLTTAISLSAPALTEKRAQIAFVEDLLGRVDHIPGITNAAITDALPPTETSTIGLIRIEGRGNARPDQNRDRAILRGVSNDYFSVLGIPLHRGRLFNAGDTAGGQDVALVNEAFVRRHFPIEDPLGHRVNAFSTNLAIVGVVADAKNGGLREDVQPEVYRPYAQSRAFRRMQLVVRTAAPPLASVSMIRSAVRGLNKDLPLTFETLDQKIAGLAAGPRFQTILLGIFAIIALLLAIIGIYGVIAYLVGQRTREIGIRMALGADPSAIAALILRHSFTLIGIGVALGLGMAFGLTRFLATLLFEISTKDVWTFVSVAALLTATALVASFVPARRAARTDPAIALRTE